MLCTWLRARQQPGQGGEYSFAFESLKIKIKKRNCISRGHMEKKTWGRTALICFAAILFSKKCHKRRISLFKNTGTRMVIKGRAIIQKLCILFIQQRSGRAENICSHNVGMVVVDTPHVLKVHPLKRNFSLNMSYETTRKGYTRSTLSEMSTATL